MPGRTGTSERKRTPSKSAKQAQQKLKAAEVQKLREGTPAVIATLLADRERSGDLNRNPEEIEISDADTMEKEAHDADLELGDEDEAVLDDLDGSGAAGDGDAYCPGASFLSESSEGDEPVHYELRIEKDGTCRFLRPTWMAGQAMTDDMDEEFDEIERRFQMFDDIASWLTKMRQKFLRHASPTALGVNALEEMNRGLPSVSPAGFLELSGIKERMSAELGITEKSVESYFSRYSTATNLVWEEGSRLPLEFLFGIEARNAWVACAVKKFFAEKKQTLNKERIAALRGITVPRLSADKEGLASVSLTSLTQPEFVARANQMAGTRWDEVLQSHFQP